jgi:hypothetical protein
MVRIPVSATERLEKATSLRNRADREIAEINGGAEKLDEPYRPSLPGTVSIATKVGW